MAFGDHALVGEIEQIAERALERTRYPRLNEHEAALLMRFAPHLSENARSLIDERISFLCSEIRKSEAGTLRK